MENEKLRQNISKLSGENNSLGEEVRTAQENLWLSVNQQQKLAKELNEYRNHIAMNNHKSEIYSRRSRSSRPRTPVWETKSGTSRRTCDSPSTRWSSSTTSSRSSATKTKN